MPSRSGDAGGVFACVDKVIEVGQDPRRFAEDLLRRLRDLVIVAAVPDALTSGLVDVAADQAERLTTQAASLGAGGAHEQPRSLPPVSPTCRGPLRRGCIWS